MAKCLVPMEFIPTMFWSAYGGKFEFFMAFSGDVEKEDIEHLKYIIDGVGASAERKAKRRRFTGFDDI